MEGGRTLDNWLQLEVDTSGGKIRLRHSTLWFAVHAYHGTPFAGVEDSMAFSTEWLWQIVQAKITNVAIRRFTH
jgi:hypothetical protein